MDYFILTTETELFRSLDGNNKCDLDAAYRSFVMRAVELCRNEPEQAFIALACSEIELLYHETVQNPDTMGKEAVYYRKALAFVRKMLGHVTFPSISPSSGLPVFSSLHWKGSLAGLMELIASLDYSGIITDDNGKPQSFAAIVGTFERMFNISISKPYDLRASLARRKKACSVLLPELREAYERNIVNCGIDK